MYPVAEQFRPVNPEVEKHKGLMDYLQAWSTYHGRNLIPFFLHVPFYLRIVPTSNLQVLEGASVK